MNKELKEIMLNASLNIDHGHLIYDTREGAHDTHCLQLIRRIAVKKLQAGLGCDNLLEPIEPQDPKTNALFKDILDSSVEEQKKLYGVDRKMIAHGAKAFYELRKELLNNIDFEELKNISKLFSRAQEVYLVTGYAIKVYSDGKKLETIKDVVKAIEPVRKATKAHEMFHDKVLKNNEKILEVILFMIKHDSVNFVIIIEYLNKLWVELSRKGHEEKLADENLYFKSVLYKLDVAFKELEETGSKFFEQSGKAPELKFMDEYLDRLDKLKKMGKEVSVNAISANPLN